MKPIKKALAASAAFLSVLNMNGCVYGPPADGIEVGFDASYNVEQNVYGPPPVDITEPADTEEAPAEGTSAVVTESSAPAEESAPTVQTEEAPAEQEDTTVSESEENIPTEETAPIEESEEIVENNASAEEGVSAEESASPVESQPALNDEGFELLPSFDPSLNVEPCVYGPPEYFE